MCETPPRSPTIVGIAVETIVWSRLDTSMPAISAEKIRLIRRRVSTMGAAAPDGATVVGGADTRLLEGFRTLRPRVRRGIGSAPRRRRTEPARGGATGVGRR